MSFMKRLAEAADERDVKNIKNELVDRYGRLPLAAKRLLKLAELRVLAAQKGINVIRVAGKRVFIYKATSTDVALVDDMKASTTDSKIRELFEKIRLV